MKIGPNMRFKRVLFNFLVSQFLHFRSKVIFLVLWFSIYSVLRIRSTGPAQNIVNNNLPYFAKSSGNRLVKGPSPSGLVIIIVDQNSCWLLICNSVCSVSGNSRAHFRSSNGLEVEHNLAKKESFYPGFGGE